MSENDTFRVGMSKADMAAALNNLTRARRVVGDGTTTYVDDDSETVMIHAIMQSEDVNAAAVVDAFFATIDTTGYTAYADCRYKFTEISTVPPTSTSDVTALKPNAALPSLRTGTATNLAEIVTPTAPSIVGVHLIPPGSLVRIYATSDGKYYFWQTTPHIVYPVGATVDGGSNGVAGSSTVTWTYTIKDQYGNTIATGLTPVNYRINSCPYNQPPAGTPALAWFDSAEVWRVYVPTETPTGYSGTETEYGQVYFVGTELTQKTWTKTWEEGLYQGRTAGDNNDIKDTVPC